MGYFDDIDNKMDKIQEVGDIERLAGNAFWYNVGAFGIFVHAIVFMVLFWTQFGVIVNFFTGEIELEGEMITQISFESLGLLVGIICFVFLISITLSVVGLIFNVKSHKAAAVLRKKNALNNMATSFNLLWIVLNLICLVLNIVLITQFIIQNI